MQTIIMYPNCDLGASQFIRAIEVLKNVPFIHIYKNLPRPVYLGLLKYAAAMIGNSSSGIVEAPFFGTPVVNIGSRQSGRERAANVIDVSYSAREIVRAIRQFQKNGFERIYKKNPYRDLNTEKRIVQILRTLKLNAKLLNKTLSY
jgi:UDP-N-acetylglucosamine 2-epimerase